LPSTCCQT